MLYLFSETADNIDSSLIKAVELANAGLTRSVGICGTEAKNGFQGFDWTVERLHELGLKGGVPIVRIDLEEDLNTRTEAVALIAHARTLRGDVGIVAPAFHLIRTFMTTVSVIADTSVYFFAISGTPLPWGEDVLHSQGILHNTRSGLISDELKRLEKYQAPEFGSIGNAHEVLSYLELRDSQPPTSIS